MLEVGAGPGPCSSTKQDQRRRRIHRKPQPDLTSPRAFPATSGKEQQTCFCSPDQVTLTGQEWKLCMELSVQSSVCLTPQQLHQVTSSGRRCALPQGKFFCAPRTNLVLSEREKSLQILILQECCGASVISHFWQAYVNSIQAGRMSSKQRNPFSLSLV